jgi:hypothetical protein
MTVIGALPDEAAARLPEDERGILLGEFERLPMQSRA